jgi:Outer membrane protein beta-barrel domain
MRHTAIVVGALVAGAITLPAQTPIPRPEIRPFVGAYVPTGSQRDLFKDATMIGLQGALELNPNFHLLGTFSWVPTHNKYVGFDENVNIFAYDIGAELGLVRPLGERWEFKPYVGLGAGARTYAYKANGLADKTCAAGYGALGSEFQLDRVALRFEARDNVFCFKSPIAGVESKTRNDVALAFGVAYHIW